MGGGARGQSAGHWSDDGAYDVSSLAARAASGGGRERVVGDVQRGISRAPGGAFPGDANGEGGMSDAAISVSSSRSLLRDFVTLTKPRIISLLLVTTIAPMFVAGDPHW